MDALTEGTTAFDLGDRPAFILGNGPSLKGFDLHSLSPYTTIGMNAAYRFWDRIGWRPTHYACCDVVVGLSHIDAIRRLIREGRGEAPNGVRPIQRFLLRHNLIEALGEDADDSRVLDFDAMRVRTPLFQIDPITTGSHALLWSGVMGCDRAVLMGIDGNYKEIVEGAKRREGIVLEITEQKSNPNYFFEDYQQPGDKYNVPNPIPDLHVSAWHKAAVALAEGGLQVANGNPMSEVRVFPFIDAAELVAQKTVAAKPADQRPNPGPKDDPQALEARRKRDKNVIIAVPLILAALVGLAQITIGLGAAVFLLAIMVAITMGLVAYLIHIALPRRRQEDAAPNLQFAEVERQLRAALRDRQS
ncbi:MAG: hypothetical protein AAFQ79_13600 [Pseudomonadota bacterium]